MPTAFRSVHADFTSSRGFRWPFPGNVATAPRPKGVAFTRGDACPNFRGDGLCLAKTARGAASGGIPLHTVLICSYLKRDVLGEDEHKIRVRCCTVQEVLDFPALLRTGQVAAEVRANLRGANLRGANLRGADLRNANLYGANLYGADLRNADLRSANLRNADLYGANLYGADLRNADLYGADLRNADLYGANLRSANLRGADLYGANLRSAIGANLYGANLRSAIGANTAGALNA